MSLLPISIITILKPILTTVGEKAAETIGEKLAAQPFEEDFWKKIKRVFIIDDEEETIKQIENKTVASGDDMEIIEKKLIKLISSNPNEKIELETAMRTGKSSTDLMQMDSLLKSINLDRIELEKLYTKRRRASVEAVGGYKNQIEITLERLHEYEEEYLALVKKNM